MTARAYFEAEDHRSAMVERIDKDRIYISTNDPDADGCTFDNRVARMLGFALVAMTEDYAKERNDENQKA